MATERASHRRWTDTWIAAAVLVVAVVVVFARSVGGGFVADDHLAIAENERIQRPESWSAFFTSPGDVDPYRFVRPLRYVEYASDWALFGESPAAFHVHSLLWHCAGAVVLLLILRRLVGDGRAALVGALFWALHPVQVEPVAWIAGRSDVAMGACSLAAILFSLRTRGGDVDLAISLVAMAVALLYKETALAVPLVVALLRWTGFSVARVWPYFAVAAAYAAYRFGVGPPGDVHRDFFPLGVGPLGVLATMCRGFGFYVVDILLPTPAFDWHMTPSKSFADGAALVWLAVHGAIVFSAVRARRQAPRWTLAVGWFYAFLLPVANWPVYVGVFTAERYLYLPLAGAALAFAWTVSRTTRAAWPAAVVVGMSAAMSIARCGTWNSDESLYATAISSHESPLALEFFGTRLRDGAVRRVASGAVGLDQETRDDFERSLAAYHRILRANRASTPSDRPVGEFALRAEINASNVCWFLGRDDEALFHAEEALRIDPQSAEAEYDRAIVLLRMGFAPQAIAAMRRATALGFPDRGRQVAGVLLEAADRSRRDGLLEAARLGYESALAARSDADQAASASRDLAALRSEFRAASAVDAEHARIAALDAELARRPRGCRDSE